MTFLLDTDHCVAWLRMNLPVVLKLEAIGWKEIAISTITIAELKFGAYRSDRVEENLFKVQTFTQKCTVIPLDEEAANRYAELKANLWDRGERIEELDMLIASVALANGLTLVTNNTRHYQRMAGLALENWMAQ